MKASKGEDIQPSQIKRIYAKAPPPGLAACLARAFPPAQVATRLPAINLP